ncbi:MAG: glycosyltransferase family 2 protein, partial [Calditrichaeota bacterium]|nr:glycosyltransferase family 2 protein [Calditrichota bacterium]
MAEILFWSALGLLMYIYVLYPLLLWMGNRFFSRKVTPDSDFLPGVSLIVAAYNEEAVIGKKLENSLEIDYPADRLEIIVA